MNKTYLTVSQVMLGIAAGVIGLYFFLFGTILSVGSFYDGFVWGNLIVVMFIIALIVGLHILVMVRFQKAKTDYSMKQEVLIWSILLLISGNIIAGIFGILASNDKQEADSPVINSVEDKLKHLDQLYDKGLITLEEYQIRRKKIIESI